MSKSKQAKREQIMKAAEALFSGGRFDQITVDEVAQRAGVGKGTIYRYFKDKEELFFEVALAGHADLCALVDAAGSGTDFTADLEKVCSAISDFFHKRHRLWHLMQSEERRQLRRRGQRREIWCSQRRHLLDSVTNLLRQGMTAGVLRSDLRLDMLAELLLGMLRSSSRGHESAMQGTPVEMIVEIFLKGTGRGNQPQPELS